MKLYADEDFDHRVVARLRALGHDVVTVMDADRRGRSDAEQLGHATAEDRVLITFNRADFHALHRGGAAHAGIITCTRDADVEALAARIDSALAGRSALSGELLRIVRGSAR
jgi:DNA-binding NarL/FixJ family response regulator